MPQARLNPLKQHPLKQQTLKQQPLKHQSFLVDTGGLIDGAWCCDVKRVLMAAAFAQFLREYASDRDGIKPSRAKRHAMAVFLKKAAAYTEIGERCRLCEAEASALMSEASPRETSPREMSEASLSEEREAFFKGLSRTCAIEGRIMVKELGDALQAAIKPPWAALPRAMPHEMAAAVFYARQRHFHAWGMAQLPSGGDEELRLRFSEALSQVLSAAAPTQHQGAAAVESVDDFVMQQLDDEDEREDARALISDLDACLEKAVRNEIPKFCNRGGGGSGGSGGSGGIGGSRGSGGSGGSGGRSLSSDMTHVEWIRRIRGAMLILEQYFDRRNQHRFFAKDARYHVETALAHPCSRRHFNERVGDVIASEIRRFDERMALLSRLTRRHYVTPERVAAAVGLCRRDMGGMTACQQATLSGMLYAMEPDDLEAVASFCAAEFAEAS